VVDVENSLTVCYAMNRMMSDVIGGMRAARVIFAAHDAGTALRAQRPVNGQGTGTVTVSVPLRSTLPGSSSVATPSSTVVTPLTITRLMPVASE